MCNKANPSFENQKKQEKNAFSCSLKAFNTNCQNANIFPCLGITVFLCNI